MPPVARRARAGILCRAENKYTQPFDRETILKWRTEMSNIVNVDREIHIVRASHVRRLSS